MNKNNKTKILLTTNPANHEGGITEFCKLLQNNFKSDIIEIIRYNIGSRMSFWYYPFLKIIVYPFFYIYDFCGIFYKLAFSSEVKAVFVHPSLKFVPLIRDAGTLFSAKMLKKKRIVMFHGWRDHVYEKIRNKKILLACFKFIYADSELIYVLSNKFKTNLISIGVEEQKIKVITTMFDKKQTYCTARHKTEKINFIFVGRVSRLKGIDELLKACSSLAKSNFKFNLNIIGHGEKNKTIAEYKEKIDKLNISRYVNFRGRITGREKNRYVAESDVFVLPSWTEGCPVALLEALGAGLFAIVSDVGAMPEIINKDTGIVVKKQNPDMLIKAMEYTCRNINNIRNRKSFIRKYAVNNYSDSYITKKIINDLTSIIK